MPNCKNCKTGFKITDGDRAFYKKMQVPEPTLCPNCRFQNKIVFRNEQRFYRRICDLCNKSTISVYSQDKPFTVYCSDCWWSDSYDPLEYAQEYDENRSFFDQLEELLEKVPKPAIMNMKSENCDYTNYSSENRNCYLLVGAASCEDCYYGYRIFSCKNVVDCYDLQKSELCYECIQSRNLYNCTYCDSCEDSSNLILCNDCIGCQDCFGCVNLRNKKFYIFNKPYSADEYCKQVTALRRNWADSKKQYEQLKLSLPHKASHIVNCQGCSGDQLSDNKNCSNCFSLHNSEECRHLIRGDRNRFVYDTCFTDRSELLYNSMSCHANYDVLAANLVWYTKNSRYVTNCFSSNDLFGCVGMKKHQYCVLNKQYSKNEYIELTKKIVDKMKAMGEWGQYFPMTLSPFAYNETIAQEFFPLTKEEILTKNLKWKEDINEIPDDIPGSAIVCEVSGKPFKLMPQEIAFYEKMMLPTPTVHPFERHQRRMNIATAFTMYDRECQKCNGKIKTTISPEQPETVYCEKCYLTEVY